MMRSPTDGTLAPCSVRESRSPGKSSATFDEVFTLLLAGGLTQDALFDAVVASHTEIVLTAHPTQVNRRTLQCAPRPSLAGAPFCLERLFTIAHAACLCVRAHFIHPLDSSAGTSTRGWHIFCNSMTGAQSLGGMLMWVAGALALHGMIICLRRRSLTGRPDLTEEEKRLVVEVRPECSLRLRPSDDIMLAIAVVVSIMHGM